MFTEDSYRWCRLPCVQLNIVDLKKCKYEKKHEYNYFMKKYIQDDSQVPVWTRAFWGKRSWKSTLINTHREPIHAVMSLFAKPHTFYDIKLNYTSYQTDKTHFTAQLLIAMKSLNAFADPNQLGVPFGTKRTKKLNIYDFQNTDQAISSQARYSSFEKYLTDDIYSYEPNIVTAQVQDYIQRSIFGKSELTKEMEFVKVYNGENFNGYPVFVDELKEEISNVSDIKFQKVYLRRLMNNDIGRIEKRLIGAYGIDAVKDYRNIFKFCDSV